MTDVRQWLDALDLGQYAETFTENQVDGAVLSHLTEHKILATVRWCHTPPTSPRDSQLIRPFRP